MNYHNAIQQPILNPVGIDRVIEDICVALGEIHWHKNIFRRAFRIYEVSGKKSTTKAKAYLKNSEYYDVLANDNFKSLSFITVDTPETILDDVVSSEWNNDRTRDLSVVFWVQLDKIYCLDYVYTEVLKREIEKALATVDSLTIKKYYDEDYRQVFKGFDIDQKDLQLMTFPYAGFRFECTAEYGGGSYDCT
jgi:hypothetical protein